MTGLTIHEVHVCRGGCGQMVAKDGCYCQRCLEEVEALNKLWDFDRQGRPRARRPAWRVWLELAAAVALMLYIGHAFLGMFAEWIVEGGPWR